jgi:antirestriction protein ArdC
MESSSKKDEVLATLAEGVARLTDSEAWRAWLNVQRRFHNYSFGNTLLILWQRPDATRVAGFHAWLHLGRHVRKGEKGIAILAPIPQRLRVEDENGDEKTVVGAAHHFRLAHVFDIAQTDGAELPDTPISKLHGDDPGRAVRAARRGCSFARLHGRGRLPRVRSQR